ncbi:MAG: carbohydrate ABC transporter permease [Thermotogaceae bacterium]|nr:carbohydrate ABC transporter permease [Thermotogaceae bacterium]
MLRKKKKRILLYVAGVIVAAVIILPLYWMFVSAISPKVELLAHPPHWFPHDPTLINLKKLIFGGKGTSGEVPNFARAMLNSTMVALITTGICLFLSIPAGYALARKFPGFRQTYLNIIITARMFPEIALVLSMYIIVSKLRIINTWWGLVFVYTSFILPYSIWMMYGYFLTIPKELDEAAYIDGAGSWKALLTVDLPLTLPGIATVSIFSFLMCWDEFLYALILTFNMKAKTITVVVSEFTTRHMIDYGLMMAGGLVATIPPLILVIIFQRYIITGLTAGAVKG